MGKNYLGTYIYNSISKQRL